LRRSRGTDSGNGDELGFAHGVLAFFFNVIIVALTINIVAGLI
jgi:uncharacterized membrane protein